MIDLTMMAHFAPMIHLHAEDVMAWIAVLACAAAFVGMGAKSGK
jgi:hypothetical protein